jgi:hypothetical protein
LTFNFGEKVDDADIEGLLSHEAKSNHYVPDRSWVDWAKMDWAKSLNLGRFFMDGVAFIARYNGEGMFIQIADNYAPCGYFRYKTIKTHVN